MNVENENIENNIDENSEDFVIHRLDGLDPIHKFIHSSCHFHTANGRIMIPEKNIDYFYENKGMPVLRTKSGRSIEILEDVFLLMKFNEVDCETTECSECEYKQGCAEEKNK